MEVDEAAVWSRVTAASQAASGGEVQDRGPIGPKLLELREKKRQMAQDYQRLAQRSGAHRKLLQTLARENRQQAQELGALFRFLTGSPPKNAALATQQRKENQRETIRRLLQAEELSAGRLEALAERTQGEARALLLRLADQDRQRFRRLLPLLG